MLFIIALIACRAEMPAAETNDIVGHDPEYGTAEVVITDDVPTDTGDSAEDTASEEVDEPCEVSLTWNVEHPVVNLSTFVLPRLEVTSTCDIPIGLRGVGLTFASGAWVSELGDGRLGIGDGNVQHLGVYAPYETTETSATWGANIEEYGVYFTPDRPVDIGFTMAAFAYNEGADIPELNDGVDDEVTLTAGIVFSADHEAGGALRAVTTILIAQ